MAFFFGLRHGEFLNYNESGFRGFKFRLKGFLWFMSSKPFELEGKK